MKNRKPELLIPAGSLEVLKTAVDYGADAVYIGGEEFGLRAMAKNFSISQMEEGISYAHLFGKKVYVTANIFAHNSDMDSVSRYFSELKEIKPDALIISDPGIFSLARNILPQTDIHISTQANNTNYETFLFWKKLGAKRLVCARELSLTEIADIRKHIPDDLEIEAFVHGAMCVSYSGRCLLSNFLTGRDANQGKCTHPCRWNYAVTEESRPGEYMPVFENERGTFIFNSRDLCMIEFIPRLMEAGIDSFKIEGRMKTALYVATVTRTYRRAIDDALVSAQLYESNLSWYKEEIGRCTHREYTTGFFFGKPGKESMIYDSSTYIRDTVYLGKAESTSNDGLTGLMQKNKFCVGDTIEIMKRDGNTVQTHVRAIYNDLGQSMNSANHASEHLLVDIEGKAEAGDILRSCAV